MIRILYEDNHIIAVYKPSGILSQPDKTGDQSMLEEVRTYLKERYSKKGNAYVGLLHRLDRPVSGIMLFAKTSKGASRLSEQFRNQTIEKTYQAIVSGKPKEKRGVLVNKIQKSQTKHQKVFKSKTDPKGDEAVLYYEILNSNGKHSLLKIHIESGKFHQIRAQLSLAGLPIVGDVKYGGEKWRDEKRIALEATGLAFTTATGDKKVNLTIDIPGEWRYYIK